MTKLLSKADERERPRFNPDPKKINMQLLLSRNKQDCLSDYCIGILRLGIAFPNKSPVKINKKIADRFESCFCIGARERNIHVPHGRPFLGPDGRPMLIEGRVLHGSNDSLPPSKWTLDNVKECDVFDAWAEWILGRSVESGFQFPTFTANRDGRYSEDDSHDDSDVSDMPIPTAAPTSSSSGSSNKSKSKAEPRAKSSAKRHLDSGSESASTLSGPPSSHANTKRHKTRSLTPARVPLLTLRLQRQDHDNDDNDDNEDGEDNDASFILQLVYKC